MFPSTSDLLACFKVTGQDGVPREEVQPQCQPKSSTGTWSAVLSELLTGTCDFYKGR